MTHTIEQVNAYLSTLERVHHTYVKLGWTAAKSPELWVLRRTAPARFREVVVMAPDRLWHSFAAMETIVDSIKRIGNPEALASAGGMAITYRLDFETRPCRTTVGVLKDGPALRLTTNLVEGGHTTATTHYPVEPGQQPLLAESLHKLMKRLTVQYGGES